MRTPFLIALSHRSHACSRWKSQMNTLQSKINFKKWMFLNKRFAMANAVGWGILFTMQVWYESKSTHQHFETTKIISDITSMEKWIKYNFQGGWQVSLAISLVIAKRTVWKYAVGTTCSWMFVRGWVYVKENPDKKMNV